MQKQQTAEPGTLSFESLMSGVLDCLCLQVVYKRYASLYFVMGIDSTDNELISLEIIHHYVEVLDKYFGNVCELDLIFNFHKVRSHARAAFCPVHCPLECYSHLSRAVESA